MAPRPAVARAAALGGVLTVAGFAPAPAAVDPPPKGKQAATVLALLHYQRDACGGALERVERRFKEAGASEEAVRSWAYQQVASDLAAGRTAGDLARRFFDGARGETSDAAGGALERIAAAANALCDAAALPTGPRSRFEGEVADLRARLRVAEDALGRLLTLPPDDLDAALDPYLVTIQLAGVEAEGEVEAAANVGPRAQKFMERRKAEMAAWHVEYGSSTVPVKRALGALLAAHAKSDGPALAKSCRELSLALNVPISGGVLRRAPDKAVGSPLVRAYTAMRSLASDCVAARYERIAPQMKVIQTELGEAAKVLAAYDLKP